MLFTVEVVSTSVTDDDWSVLRRVLDTVPGTVLIEDAEMPTLVLPVDAADAGRAVMFVDGLSKLVGFDIVSGQVYPSPEIDFDVPEDEDHAAATPIVMKVQSWVEETPAITGKVTRDGRLVDA